MAATTIAATKVPHMTTQGHFMRLREKQPGVTWGATVRDAYGTARPRLVRVKLWHRVSRPPRWQAAPCLRYTAHRRPVRTGTEAPGRTCQPRGSPAPCHLRRPSSGASLAGRSFGLPSKVGWLACCRARGLACCRADGAGVLACCCGCCARGCCAGLTVRHRSRGWVSSMVGLLWHKANQPPPFRKRTALERGPAGAVDREPRRPPSCPPVQHGPSWPTIHAVGGEATHRRRLRFDAQWRTGECSRRRRCLGLLYVDDGRLHLPRCTVAAYTQPVAVTRCVRVQRITGVLRNLLFSTRWYRDSASTLLDRATHLE